MRKQVEAARSLALVFVDRHLDGDEAAKRAVAEVSFVGDARGQQSAANRMVALIVSLTVGAIIAAYLLPLGLQELTGADLGENTSEGAESLWGIMDVMIVLSLFLAFVAVALAAADEV